MTSNKIRKTFLDFFQSKQHKIVPSAPLVNKNDPTLMFTNSGMVQFKDYFLGNQVPSNPRIADTQKCLRVSGKHNDLEDVGFDGTHHTLFEMLGNWSFGDYFKEEAIAWSWELLTDVFKIPKDILYATVFGGDEKEGLLPDEEAKQIWLKYLPADHILYGSKKDNFWEMGEQGPCGPCSEIHVDLRSKEEKELVEGSILLNKDHPKVIEIWNNVFIQFERKADGSLHNLPSRHVDTGMGFERLCMVLQGKEFTYDTDVFTPTIEYIESISGIKYKGSFDRNAKSDIAIRVVADHIRAVTFTIADGELPSNTGAGYVIRRILRRAVRYYYSFLDIKDPILYRIVGLLADQFISIFPEIDAQRDFITKVILEEEKSFLRTLESGLKKIEGLHFENGIIDGNVAFELYDTFGFPIDLTRLIAAEKGCKVDEAGFEEKLKEQKNRSKIDAQKQIGDWHVVLDEPNVVFFGYDTASLNGAKAIKYRTVEQKGKSLFQLVLNKTPFYAEGGGQVGDTGFLMFDQEKIQVLDTKKENDLIIHIIDKLPENITADVSCVIDESKRRLVESNHSATHLLHAALRNVLGNHVHQKGSLVNANYLRFDFSHFQKLTDEEIEQIENMVNSKIRQNIILKEYRNLSIEDAKNAGAMMLFGEKYGDLVRMIEFDSSYSIELCGGCHVSATGKIGLFKITSESAIAAGVRRIEAVTGFIAEQFVDNKIKELNEIKMALKNPKNTVQYLQQLQDEIKTLKKEIEKIQEEQMGNLQTNLLNNIQNNGKFNFVVSSVPFSDPKIVKTLAYNIEKSIGNAAIVFGSITEHKPLITIVLSQQVTELGLHAGNLVKQLAAHIQGGGGGQAFFATAGGTNQAGLNKSLEEATTLFKNF